MTAVDVARSRVSLPVPAARPQPFMHMFRRGRHDVYRGLVPGNRNPDLARMQVQGRLAEAGTVAVDVVADDRPAHRGGVHAQLVGAAGDGFHGKPGKALATPQDLPMGDGLLPIRARLLPPAALGAEAAERAGHSALRRRGGPADPPTRGTCHVALPG